MIHVTVKVCEAQPTDKVGVTLFSTDVLTSTHRFVVENAAELRAQLAPYEDVEGAIVFLNGTEAGPAFAAADNYEYDREMFK